MRILNLVCWAVLGIFAAKIKMKTLHWFILLIIIALISATTTIIAVENITVGGTVCL
jgi:hypothetical protein